MRRSYKAPKIHEDALQIIKDVAGTQLDAELVKYFLIIPKERLFGSVQSFCTATETLRTAERSFQRKNIGHAAEKQFWKGLRIEDFLLAEGWRTDWPSRASCALHTVYNNQSPAFLCM